MVKKLFDFYNNLDMHYKLFLTYLLIISIPFSAFIILNNYILSKDMEKQALFSSRQIFYQSRSYIEYKVNIVKTYMDVISSNEKIQEIKKKDSKIYYDNLGLWVMDLNEIRKQFLISKPGSDIVNTHLYLNDSITGIDETDDFHAISSISNTNWYKKLVAESNFYGWFNSSNEKNSNTQNTGSNSISAVRIIQNSDNITDIIGLVRVDLPESVFKTLLDHAAFFKSSSVYLVDNNNEILCCSSSTKTEHFFFAPEIIKKYSNIDLQSGVWNDLKLKDKKYLVGIQSVRGTTWNLVITIPSSEILASQAKTIKQMLLIILIIAPFTFPLAYLGASSGTKRIRKLITTMRAVQNGDFNIQILPSGRDEIGELTRNFNTMITKISMLLDEKYKMGQEMRSIELKALQAQINPHFLYNTLDLIYWKAVRIKENSIYELVKSLSKFYKLSLSKGNDIVELKNEIEHIKAYVQIQNTRFDDCAALLIDIPEEFYSYKIPKITLQPIVENAIIHGILETEDEKGTITITGYKDNLYFYIEVKDDGVGIPEDQLVTILDNDSSDALHGYGVNNINRRLKLFFGQEYGLTYESSQNHGTTARIQLPPISLGSGAINLKTTISS